MTNNQPASPPKKWKMVVVVWLSIYPLITLISTLFGRQLSKINPTPLRTLVLTAILVPTMVYVMIPLAQKVLASWLTK